MNKYVKQELYDDTEMYDEEISTWPVDGYQEKDECFYDEDHEEEEYVETHYAEFDSDGEPTERSGAARTIQIPDPITNLFMFLAFIVYGSCLLLAPTEVTTVSCVAGAAIMFYLMKSGQDSEDDTLVPMDVDSSSSDNLFAPEPVEEMTQKPIQRTVIPTQTTQRTVVKPKNVTLQMKVSSEPEVPLQDLHCKELGDGPIYLGESALLKQWIATLGPTLIQSGKHVGKNFEEIFAADKEYGNCLGRCLKLDADPNKNYNLCASIKMYVAYHLIRKAVVTK